jgi:3-deoxy-7-phosphoheptulonate synthase
VEDQNQLRLAGEFTQKNGARLLRGGIFKMRTDPASFQGLGLQALEWISSLKKELSMPLVTEITDARHIEPLLPVVDMFQVGTRNMYNYALLKELGKTKTPVLLKRGFSALAEEWLLAAEYVLKEGNPNVVLCERGIRTFEKATRNTLDLGIVPWVKARSDLPVLVDPSHGTGVSALVPAMCWAAAAAGADGIMVEVHPDPAKAKSDGYQALSFEAFGQMMAQLRQVVKAMGRSLD